MEKEVWKDIPNYEGLYEVSNLGNVKNKRTNKILSNCKSWGYVRISLCKNKSILNKFVHRLVMLAFVGECKTNLVINHINGVKHDNRLENLEYCSQSHNKKQDFILGRQSFLGEKNTQSKLNSEDIFEIRRLRANGYTYSKLAKKFNMSISGISNIFNGHTWTHLA